MRMDADSVVYPAPIPPGVVLDKNVPVPMRDGIRLAIDVYRPAEMRGPSPAILAYSPFQKERSFEGHRSGCSRDIYSGYRWGRF